ncbi:type IV secretion system DNA-binding domain-containing protein (plasmid) [Escherichia coli]
MGETRRKKFSEQTSFGHEQVRDGISFGKEEERVTVVTYSDVQKLNDLQCYVTLPGDYPVVKLSMSYEAMPKVADALLLRDVQTSLDQTLEDEIRRRSEEERHKFAGLFEGESLIQAVPGGAFIPEGNLSNTPPLLPTWWLLFSRKRTRLLRRRHCRQRVFPAMQIPKTRLPLQLPLKVAQPPPEGLSVISNRIYHRMFPGPEQRR